jgi:hypothetical protein
MSRSTPWLPSSGVGAIPGDGRPLPDDIIRIAEEQAQLERLAQKQETTLQLTQKDVPKDIIPGIKLSLATEIRKVKS